MAGFLSRVISNALTSASESPFHKLLSKHFSSDPQALPIITEAFDANDHPNLHLALQAYIEHEGRSAELYGVGGGSEFACISLSRLISGGGSSFLEGPPASPGPVQYLNIPVDEQVLACVQRGLYLIRSGNERYAAFLRGPTDFQQSLQLEVLGRNKEAAQALLTEVRHSMRDRNIYRGRVLSFERAAQSGNYQIRFRRIPPIERHQIILPAGLLDRVERHAVHFAHYGRRLLAAGRHLKRGILFHGRPGTGKTLTVMYLATQMRDRTVFLTAGFDFGWLSQICQMARALQPALIVLEDVDLIAEDRSRPGCASPLLYELLNQMDGLSGDTDVLFLLTTNRAEVLEPALATRPGRIDQAIEFPLPDALCRRKLFQLYGDGLTMDVRDPERFIGRTEGASPAFIRELLRKAALFSAEKTADTITIRDEHLDEALRELVIIGGPLTRALLGAVISSEDRE